MSFAPAPESSVSHANRNADGLESVSAGASIYTGERQMSAEYIPPELWVIFDSQGPYELRESESNAMDFCDQYNRREQDPLRPYTYRRYIAADRGERQMTERHGDGADGVMASGKGQPE